jgi:hypothetical protein
VVKAEVFGPHLVQQRQHYVRKFVSDSHGRTSNDGLCVRHLG